MRSYAVLETMELFVEIRRKNSSCLFPQRLSCADLCSMHKMPSGGVNYIHSCSGSSRPRNISETSFQQGSERLHQLNLFHSLDEFSSYVEPICPSSYECLPSGYDDSNPKAGVCPRAFMDIWSHDSQSTSDSRTHEPLNDYKLSEEPVRGFIDYSHFLHSGESADARHIWNGEFGKRDLERPGVSWREMKPSVVLNLSNLIG